MTAQWEYLVISSDAKRQDDGNTLCSFTIAGEDKPYFEAILKKNENEIVFNGLLLSKFLNLVGQDGWELSMRGKTSPVYGFWIFKRPVQVRGGIVRA